jgi:hypothetical protein
MKVIALLALILPVTAASAAAERSFERYQSIIDRQMFGNLPADFDPAKSPNEVTKSGKKDVELSKEQERVKSAVHFSMIDQPPGGDTVVGFSDNSDPKAPKHYRLKVGESSDGWTVVEADARQEKMKIVKDDIEVELKLGGNSAKDGNATSRARDMKTLEQRSRSERPGLLQRSSLQSRRMSRKKREDEERKRENEEQADRKVMMEELRQMREQLMAINESDRTAKEESGSKEPNNGENNAESVQE